MNSIAGKSTGIALLMAAALLAALFAMGVFSATGVGANFTGTVSAELSTPDPGADVEIEILFISDVTIDGFTDGNTTSATEDVSISIPIGAAATNFTFTAGGITATAKQNGLDVGKITINETADDTIIIGPRDNGTSPVVAGTLVTVTVTGLKNPTAATENIEITVAQQDDTNEAITYDDDASPQPTVDVFAGLIGTASLSSTLPGDTGVTMTLEFTPGESTADVSITLPEEYDLLDGGTSLQSGWAVTLDGADPDEAFTYTAATNDVGDIINIPAENLTAGTEYEVFIGNDALDDTDPVGFTNLAAGTYTVSFQAGTGSGQTERTAVEATITTAVPSPEYKATDATEPGSNQSLSPNPPMDRDGRGEDTGSGERK